IRVRPLIAALLRIDGDRTTRPSAKADTGPRTKNLYISDIRYGRILDLLRIRLHLIQIQTRPPASPAHRKLPPSTIAQRELPTLAPALQILKEIHHQRGYRIIVQIELICVHTREHPGSIFFIQLIDFGLYLSLHGDGSKRLYLLVVDRLDPDRLLRDIPVPPQI